MDLYLAFYRAVLRVLPRRFRSRYGDEMVEIAAERIAVGGFIVLLSESGSVLLTAARLRLRRPQLELTAALAIALMILLLREDVSAAGDFEVKATDPAGEFTLVLRDGRAVAGTIDRQPLSPHQLVHAGDSIRVLAKTGAVLFAVAYDRDRSSIAWEPRSADCRGRALNCGVDQ